MRFSKSYFYLYFIGLCASLCLAALPAYSFSEVDEPKLPVKRIGLAELSIASNHSSVSLVLNHMNIDHTKSVETIGSTDVLKLEPLAKHKGSIRHTNRFDQNMAEMIAAHFMKDGKLKRNFRRNDLARYYQSRAFSALWHKNGVLTKQARELILRLAQAETDGLDSRDYHYRWQLDYPSANHEEAIEALIKQELTLSQLAIAYFQDARRGRIKPSDLPGDIGFKQKKLDGSRILATLAAYDNPSHVLTLVNPKTPLFQTMQRQLGMILQAERLAQHKPVKTPNHEDFFYDPIKAVTGAAQAFTRQPDQSSNTNQTLFIDRRINSVSSFDVKPVILIPKDSMARFLQHRKADLMATMELARWLPDDMGNTYVAVNIPEFRVRVVEDGETIHNDRVVVGKPRFRTPIFADKIQSIVVNPYWNVPKSIMLNEMLPKLRANKSLGRGYEVVSPVGKVSQNIASRLSTASIAKGYRVRQRPGPGNALGSIKFLFPNKFSVYMHDTPAKKLFSRNVRAFSHGCVRLNDPWAFAEVISDLQNQVSFDDLNHVRGSSREEWFDLDQEIPVVIAYLPFYIDDNDVLRQTEDIYGYLGVIRKKLGLK